MANISIDHQNVEQTAASLAARAKSEVINAGTASCEKILGILEVSSGEFADSLREEIGKEKAVVEKAGNLLVALADYIQKASSDFAEADQRHQQARVNE